MLQSEDKGVSLFDVDRRLVDKETGEVKLETRRREVPDNEVQFFILGYKKAV